MKVYNIDEYNISSFCVNTVKAFNNENNKFILFKKLLHTFHELEEIYEETIEQYISYISYAILKDILIKDKNILQYEQYFFNVIAGFYNQKYKKRIDTKIIARSWSNIVNIFNIITDLASNPHIKDISFYNSLFNTFKHLNTKVHKNTYELIVPILFEKENGFEVVLILPRLKNNSYNIVIPFLLNYFKNTLHKIHIIDLSLTSIDYGFTTVVVTPSLLQSYNKHFETLFIDFNKINFYNCNFCPLSCTKTELLNTRFEITPFNPNKKIIKVINI